MRVLVVDPLSFSGHVNYNHGIITALAAKYEYDIVCNENHYEHLIEKGVPKERFIWTFSNDWNIVSLSKKHCKLMYHLLYRLYFLRIILSTFFFKKKYDYLLFTSVEIESFWWISFLFNNRCAIVDHGIGSVLNSWHYKLSWRFCNNSINIIVLEEFIKKMVNDVLPSKSVYVVHHPLPLGGYEQASSFGEKIVLFAPSNSNDDSFLRILPKTVFPNNIFVLAKSRNFEFESESLKITSGFISNDNYQRMMHECDFILLPYEDNYNYRISAILFEAIVLNKKILLYNNNTLSYYKGIFPENIFLFDSMESLVGLIEKKSHLVLRSTPNLKDYNRDALTSQISLLIG